MSLVLFQATGAEEVINLSTEEMNTKETSALYTRHVHIIMRRARVA